MVSQGAAGGRRLSKLSTYKQLAGCKYSEWFVWMDMARMQGTGSGMATCEILQDEQL